MHEPASLGVEERARCSVRTSLFSFFSGIFFLISGTEHALEGRAL